MSQFNFVPRTLWARGGVFAAFVVAAAPFATAQSTLDPVVVTATREPQPLARVTADLVVIDRRSIERSSADSIEDLLRREAGVQVSRTGGPGQSASVFLRGTSTGSTVVLIDGVRIGSATLGQVEFESIGLAQIERIEVLRGPGSSLYGADAVGGVIQIFTRQGNGSPRLAAHAAVGGYGSSQGNVNLSGSVAGFDYAAGFGRERSRGVSALLPGDPFGNYNPDADGYARNTAQLRLGVTPAAGHRVGLSVVKSQLNAQYDGAEYLPPDYAPNAAPDFRSHLDTQVTALDYRGQLSDAWRTTVQLSRNSDELQSGGSLLAPFDTHRDQLTWQNALTVAPGHEVVVALERLTERAKADGYAAEQKRDTNALVLGYAGSVSGNSLQADLRHDDNSVYGGVTTGRLGWSLEVLPGWRVRALAGTTFRAPSFNDLFYPGYGVSTVRPEKGRSIELGLTWQAGDSRASATVYRNTVRDLIAYQPDRTFCPVDPAYDFGCASNVGSARLQGATLSAGQRWGGFSLAATVDFLDAKDTATGNRLPRRAAHQESIQADHAWGDWSLGAALLDVGARPDGTATLGGYTTLDLKARWRVAPQWQLEAKLLNATDRQIDPARYYQALGRQAWIGIRFDGQGL